MKRHLFEIEICANSIQSVLAAEKGGSYRVELCDNLLEGGTTPSIGLLQQVKSSCSIDVFPIIRPRGGDFLYNEDEIQIMLQDIDHCLNAGADGIVVGCLKKNGDIDVELLKRFVNRAKGKPATFHRAFDLCRDPFQALEEIVDAGCSRILTSGQQNKAEQGLDLIRELVEMAGDRIKIMIGSGIEENNIKMIAEKTKAFCFHASLRESFPSAMSFQKDNISMGGDPLVSEYQMRFSSENRIKKTINILEKLFSAE